MNAGLVVVASRGAETNRDRNPCESAFIRVA
jgi:hypothetical protein